MFNNTHMFTVGTNHYALDCKNIFFCLLDKKTQTHLKSLICSDTHNFDDSLPSHVVSELVKSGYFVSDKQDTIVVVPQYDVMNISFAPVHECNFSCAYCYAIGGERTQIHKMRFTEAKIDLLMNYIYFEKYSDFKKYKFDFVSGGEPLLNIATLEYFLKTVRRVDTEHGKETTVLIVTNGALLTAEIINILDRYDVFLGISIDGPEATHNKHRKYKDGRGTYHDVVKGISTLRTSKSSSKIKNAWAMSVITNKTGSLVNLMETCVALGFNRMQMQLVRIPQSHPLSFSNLEIARLKEHYIDLISHILKHAAAGELSRIKMIANDNDSFGKFISRLLLRTPVYHRCFAGKNKVAIMANGEIYPCDSFCGESEFCMGSVFDSSLENTSIAKSFQEGHIQNRVSCSKCWARRLCGGDCYYNSYMKNGDIYIPDVAMCEMNKFFIQLAIDFLIKLKEINADYMNYLARFLNH